METKEYVKTIVYKGKMVNIGLDDYGQCYFFEFVNKDGELQQVGCGTYNEDYMNEIKGYFETPEERNTRMIRDLRDDIQYLLKELNELKEKDSE